MVLFCWILNQELNRPGQVSHVDSWNNIISSPHDRKSSQLWMQRQPSPPKKFVEHVVGLPITIRQSTAEHMHLQFFVYFIGRHRKLFQRLQLLILWRRYFASKVILSVCTAVTLRLGVCPSHHTRNKEKNLFLGFHFGRLKVRWRSSQNFQDELSFLGVCATDHVQDNIVGLKDLFMESFGLGFKIKHLD